MTWKKVPMAERLRFCQFHQKDHAYPLHCITCGGELPPGIYYRCRPCTQQKEANRRAEIAHRNEATKARSLSTKDQNKLAVWKEWAKA